MDNVNELYKQCEEARAALEKKRAEFIQMRTQQELEVQAFAESVKKTPPEVFEGIVEIPEELSLRTLTPEAYAEHPNKEVYQEQYKKALEFATKVNGIIAEGCKEAIACTQESEEISSSAQ